MAARVGHRATSVSWSAVPKGPADPCATRAATVHCTPCPLLRLVLSLPPVPLRRILGLVEAFNKDTNPKKASLSVGAYRDGDGKPWVLPSVKEAERRVVESNLNKEYAGITGLAKYAKLAIKFALGADLPALQEGRVASVQTLSGTGACRVIGEFYSRFLGKGAPIYLPTPTWGNHIPIMRDAGLDVRSYRYFDKATNGLDYEGMMEDLAAIPDGAAVTLRP